MAADAGAQAPALYFRRRQARSRASARAGSASAGRPSFVPFLDTVHATWDNTVNRSEEVMGTCAWSGCQCQLPLTGAHPRKWCDEHRSILFPNRERAHQQPRNVYVNDDLWEWARHEAERQRVTISALIRAGLITLRTASTEEKP